MKRAFLLLTIIALVSITSCNKNQRAVKKLDGKWEMISGQYTDEDGTISFEKGGTFLTTLEMTFTNCKLKDNEWCNFSWYIVQDGDTDNISGLFKVTEDGAKLTLTDPVNIGLPGWTSEYTISELDKTNLIIEGGEPGETWKFNLEKK